MSTANIKASEDLIDNDRTFNMNRDPENKPEIQNYTNKKFYAKIFFMILLVFSNSLAYSLLYQAQLVLIISSALTLAVTCALIFLLVLDRKKKPHIKKYFTQRSTFLQGFVLYLRTRT